MSLGKIDSNFCRADDMTGYMDELRMNWIEMQDLGLWEWQLGFRFEHVESWESRIKWGDGGWGVMKVMGVDGG